MIKKDELITLFFSVIPINELSMFLFIGIEFYFKTKILHIIMLILCLFIIIKNDKFDVMKMLI